MATELEVREVKMGILRDDVFSATPPAVRLPVSLVMTDNKQAKTHKLMFIDTSSSLLFAFHETSVRGVAPRKRETGGEQRHVWNRRRGGELRRDCHGNVDEHESLVWKVCRTSDFSITVTTL